MRLGIYADLLYRSERGSVSTDRAFVLFLAGLAERFREVVVFGRLDPVPGRAPYVLPPNLRFVALPHYNRTSDLASMCRAIGATRTAFARELDGLDAVWLFGPHPVALELLRVARRRTQVVLGVRQDFPSYVAWRVSGSRRVAAVPAAHALEQTFRLLARRLPTVVVGDALANRYRRHSGSVHALPVSLVRVGDVVEPGEALRKEWEGELRLLAVGRLDPEKNPLLLPEILVELRRQGAPWKLTIAGDGRLTEALTRRVRELGLGDSVDMRGYVPYGPALLNLYRTSHALLHVSLTEGLPQVLLEAQASGLAIVATDVGGVRTALANGERGLLVPPRDARGAAAACERLRHEPALRERLIHNGVAFARAHTMDAELDRLAAFLAARAA